MAPMGWQVLAGLTDKTFLSLISFGVWRSSIIFSCCFFPMFSGIFYKKVCVTYSDFSNFVVG
jgi:hypothetical protein